MQKFLNTAAIVAIATIVSTEAFARGHGGLDGLLGGLLGGGKGAPGPEAAVGLPFLAVAGAYALIRRRRARRSAA